MSNVRRALRIAAFSSLAVMASAQVAPVSLDDAVNAGIVHWDQCDLHQPDTECYSNFAVDGQAPPQGLSLDIFEVVQPNSRAFGSTPRILQIQVKYEGDYELVAGSAPLTMDSVVSFDIEMGGFDAAMLIGSWVVQHMSMPGGGQNVFSAAFKPQSHSFAMNCTIQDCGDDTTAAMVDYEGFMAGALSEPFEPPPQQGKANLGPADLARGTFFSTNAMSFGTPTFGAGGLELKVAGPHFKSDGETLNEGVFRAFLPMSLVDGLWDISDTPGEVAPNDFVSSADEGGSSSALSHTITPISDPATFGSTGILIEVEGLHFSAPTVEIAPAVVPRITIGRVRVTEGHSGTKRFQFPLSLSEATTRGVSVSVRSFDGTATRRDRDYVERTPVRVTIGAGRTRVFVNVYVRGDRKVERDEYFVVRISSPINATLGTSGAKGTIVNDDRASRRRARR